MNALVIQNELVSLSNREPVTTSLIVAEKFNKRHDHVLRAVQNLECSEKFRLLNFGESSYRNEQNKKQPMYTITRDGFMFLAMGFTGKKAAQWKERFIEAFKYMESALAIRNNPEWQQARIEGKTGRRVLTDAIRIFIDYAREQGSKSPQMYYVNYTRMIQSFVGGEKRDDMPAHTLVQMNAAEQVAAGIIMEGMEKNLFYKDIFQSVKPVLDNMLRLWNLPRVRLLEAA